MSQHHLTVSTANGITVKLIAGWDRPLQQFFLDLTDQRFSEEEDSKALPAHNPARRLVLYDSAGYPGYENMSMVEKTLRELNIPFVPRDQDGACINPQLLPLLGVLLEERDGPQNQPINVIRNWDRQPDRAAAIADWDAQYVYPYHPGDPHVVFSVENYKTWLDELKDDTQICPYKTWLMNNLIDQARQRQLAQD